MAEILVFPTEAPPFLQNYKIHINETYANCSLDNLIYKNNKRGQLIVQVVAGQLQTMGKFSKWSYW